MGYLYNSSRNFNGKIDEVRVWKRALSPTEISQNMCNVSVPATSLAAYWKFNEGSGSTVQDSSGNGISLSLTGVDSSNWGTDLPCAASTSTVSKTAATQRELSSANTKNPIRIFPNPISKSSSFTVSVPDEYNKGKLTIFDFYGRIMSTKSLNAGNNQYESSGLSSGNYILQFESWDGNIKQTEKLMIQ